MAFQDAYIAELEHEAKSTRKLLERIPDGKFDWAPHEKSMKLGSLGNHIAALAGRPKTVLTLAEVDMQSPQVAVLRGTASTNTADLVARFDNELAEARKALQQVTEEQLAGTYTLRSGQDVIFSLPRTLSLRVFVLNHIIHHRGQLSVYLRLLDVPIPSIYGPSADEKV